MFTTVVPFIIYFLSLPIMILTLFRVEIGILYFMTFVPVIALMKKITEFPLGNNFADFFLIAIVLGSIGRRLKQNRPIFTNSPLNYVVLLFVLGSLLNLIRGYFFIQFGDQVHLTRLMTWKNYMILPVIYFIALNNIENESFLKWVIFSACCTMLAMDFNFYSTFRWMKGEHYSHSIRISGPFSFLGPNELALFYSYMSFLLLGIVYFIDDKPLKYFVCFVSACNLYPIVYSYSRSAYVCTLAGCISLGIIKDRRLLLLLVIFLFIYRSVLPNSVVERIDMTFLGEEVSEISDGNYIDSSAVEVGGVTVDTVGRKELWEKAIKYFKNNPVLGTGFDTFRHTEGMITHSMYLKILAEQGLLGMLIFIIFTTTVLLQSHRLFKRSLSRLGKGVGLGLLVCTITTLVGSITGDQSLYYNVMALYWLFIGIVASFNVKYVDSI